MKAIKATGHINDQGQIALDQPLINSKNSRIEVIVLIPEDTEAASSSTQNIDEVAPPQKKRQAGFLKGTFTLPLPDDFDQPLDDLKEYME